MQEQQRVGERLENIRTVKPILSALHTISMGSLQAATRRRSEVQRYVEQLRALLPLLLPHLSATRGTRRARPAGQGSANRVVALVVGSERGLCGRFNAAVVEQAEAYLAERADAGVEVELMVLGTRVLRLLRRRGYQSVWSGTLSITAMPPFELAFDLTQQWLQRYEAHELDAADLIYNAYRGMGRYDPTVSRLIPPTLPTTEGSSESPQEIQDELWPPTIVETDPLRLYVRVIEQWAAVGLYGLLLESASAEHAARFELMESASQNADQLIDELTQAIQTARQQAITQEMQELAAGAGLIGGKR